MDYFGNGICGWNATMMANGVRDHPKDTKFWGVKWAMIEMKTVCSISGSFSFLPPSPECEILKPLERWVNISGPMMRPTPNGAFSRKNFRMKGSLKQKIYTGWSYLHGFCAQRQAHSKAAGQQTHQFGNNFGEHDILIEHSYETQAFI